MKPGKTRGINEKIQNFIGFLERDRFSLLTIFLLVFFIGFVRGVLEGMCTEPDFLFSFRGIIANDIFTSLSAFFGGTLVVNLFVKERFRKVWNATIFFWFLFFIPPIFDTVFIGSCPGYWGFTGLHHIQNSSPISIAILPIFLMEVGFSPGLIFMGVCFSLLSLSYTIFKTRSLKKTLGMMIVIYTFVFFELTAPVFWYLPTEIIRWYKAIPFSFVWYFLLSIIWGAVILLMRRDFARKLLGKVNVLVLLAPALTIAGYLLTAPFLFDTWDLFVFMAVSSFMMSSLLIIMNLKVKDWDIRKRIVSLFAQSKEKTGKFPDAVYLEIVLFMQFVSLYFGLAEMHQNAWFLYLVAICVLIPYAYLIARRIAGERVVGSFFISLMACLAFLIGYSKDFLPSSLLGNPLALWLSPVFLILFIVTMKRKTLF